MRPRNRALVLMAAFLAAGLWAVPIASAETLEGSNVDERMLLGFQVEPTDLQPWQPEGWNLISFPKGPFAGANLLVGLEDRLLARDAEGEVLTPASSRAVAFLGLGKQVEGDGIRLFVLRVFTTNPDYDPFMNAEVADISREATTGGPAAGARVKTEAWAMTPAMGEGELTVEVTFTTGKVGWNVDKARPFSNVDPNHSLVFEYERLIDVVMSEGLGKPLAGAFEVTNTVPELAEIFDGEERLMGILDMPVYVRDVFTLGDSS